MRHGCVTDRSWMSYGCGIYESWMITGHEQRYQALLINL